MFDRRAFKPTLAPPRALEEASQRDGCAGQDDEHWPPLPKIKIFMPQVMRGHERADQHQHQSEQATGRMTWPRQPREAPDDKDERPESSQQCDVEDMQIVEQGQCADANDGQTEKGASSTAPWRIESRRQLLVHGNVLDEGGFIAPT